MPDILTILIDGQVLDRCDQKCYDSNEHSCRCVCGGHNHGVGRIQAVKNTIANAPSILKRIAARYPGTEEILFHYYL